MTPPTEPLKPGRYEHYKGKYYRVLGVARHSETGEDLVVYETLYDHPGPKLWARPLSMFLDEVTVNGVTRPRFRYTGSE